VALHSGTLVVGAPRLFSVVSFTPMPSGEAYVYERTGDKFLQKKILRAEHASSSDYFGSSVSVNASSILIGALGDGSSGAGLGASSRDANLPLSGAAYLFANDSSAYPSTAYIKAAHPSARDLFGFGNAMSDDFLVITALWESSAAANVGGDETNEARSSAGAAYVFR
jgi:hypothetical protein